MVNENWEMGFLNPAQAQLQAGSLQYEALPFSSRCNMITALGNSSDFKARSGLERFLLQKTLRNGWKTMNVTHLECGLCGLRHEARRLHNLCTQCGKPLLVRYDLTRASKSLTKEALKGREPDLWRYREVLPVDA